MLRRKTNKDKEASVKRLLHARDVIGDKIITERLVRLAERGELTNDDIIEELRSLNDYRSEKQVKQTMKFAAKSNSVFIGEFAR